MTLASMHANAACDSQSQMPESRAMHKRVERDSKCTFSSMFTGLVPTTLEDTNRLAKMLNRIDTKYVLNQMQFEALIGLIKQEYAILRINGLSQFSYASCYYDDNFGCYFEHHQGRRQRMKVRTREYVDSGSKYFEVKLKGLRGMTNKHRTACDFLVTDKIDGAYLDMLNDIYCQNYHKVMPFELSPALMVRYQRCTLVALKGGERVTIDYNLSFAHPQTTSTPIQISNDFIIVETKSKDGKGMTDQALKNLNIRKARKCSKYCIGVNLTGEVTKNNHFLHTVRHIQKNIIHAGAGHNHQADLTPLTMRRIAS